MLRSLALIAIVSVSGCRCGDDRGAGSSSADDAAASSAAATIGSGPSPVYPERVELASELRPDALEAVPGTSLVAVSGLLDGKPALQLIDIDAAKVVWTDTRWCVGRVVHATATRLLCASGKGVQAIAVADGTPAWSTPRKYRAAHGDRVLAGTAHIDVETGKPERVETDEPPYLRFIRRLCPDGALYAWLPSGVLMRLSPGFGIVWNADLGAPPTQVDACGDPALFEAPARGEQRQLVALDPDTGELVGGPVPVLGWWSAVEGDRIVIADADGVHTRTRALADPQPIAPARAAERAIAEGPNARLVRTVAGTLLVVDDDGIRAWLAAPTAPRAAAITERRLLAAGWAVNRSAAERLQLYELPMARMPWPTAPLARREPAVVTDAALTPLPDPTDPDAAVQVADAEHGKHGTAAVAVGAGAVYAAVLERRPSKTSGTAVAAFDLREREWTWYQPKGCAVDATVTELAVAGGAVVCAARSRAEAGELVAVDARTGEPRWRKSLPAIDRLLAAGDHLVAVAGERALVIDPADGEVARSIRSDNGHVPRVAVVTAGVVAVERGDIVGPGWRVDVEGHVAQLAASEDAVLAALADGSFYSIDPASGEAREVSGWSASQDIVVAGDRFFDIPQSPDDTYVLRGYGADGTETLRVILPRFARIAPARVGSGAPVLMVDPSGASRVFEFDPASGAPTAVHRMPPHALDDGVFSAVVDGEPVAGVVLRAPLSVYLFPR